MKSVPAAVAIAAGDRHPGALPPDLRGAAWSVPGRQRGARTKAPRRSPLLPALCLPFGYGSGGPACRRVPPIRSAAYSLATAAGEHDDTCFGAQLRTATRQRSRSARSCKVAVSAANLLRVVWLRSLLDGSSEAARRASPTAASASRPPSASTSAAPSSEARSAPAATVPMTPLRDELIDISLRDDRLGRPDVAALLLRGWRPRRAR